MSQPFYITTAIAYPNGKPHIGHAYEAIATDAIARFQRLNGREVCFVTGTDEHGLKMDQTARAAGKATRDLADEMSLYFKQMCETLDISYDHFCRTTAENHHTASQAIWKRLEASGDLYLDRYEGWYSVRDEAYYDESELTDGEGGRSFHPKERRSNGPLRKAGFSGCPNMSSHCWNITLRTPILSARIAAKMKPSNLSKAD